MNGRVTDGPSVYICDGKLVDALSRTYSFSVTHAQSCVLLQGHRGWSVSHSGTQLRDRWSTVRLAFNMRVTASIGIIHI